METPTNPLLNIADIAAIAELAHAGGALLVVDNTFASPYLQQPLELGADVVVHSTTKYCGGHSDVIGGALVVADAGARPSRSRSTRTRWARSPGPFDSWLVLRGLKTLAVRMERHSDNAEAVAAFLAEHPAVSEVYYPGLPGTPATTWPSGRCGAPAGWSASASAAASRRPWTSARATKVFILGESLGGVESLIEHPAG